MSAVAAFTVHLLLSIGNLTNAPQEKTSSEELFRIWYDAVQSTSSVYSPWNSAIRNDIRRVERPLCKRIDAHRDPATRNVFEICNLARLARHLGSKKASASLRRVLLTDKVYVDSSETWPDPLLNAIASIEGTKATKFLAELSRRESAHPRTRVAALIALGRIGSDESVNAFARLRDEAFGMPGAPVQLERYTHAQKMHEAALMTLFTIPGIKPRGAELNSGARVDSDYLSGTLDIGNESEGSTTLKMKRFGAEWMVVEFEYRYISDYVISFEDRYR